MTIDDQLKQAMRATVDPIRPPVSELVDGGLARGRTKRRRLRLVLSAATVGVVTAVTAGTIAIPQLWPSAGGDDYVADTTDGVAAAPDAAAEEGVALTSPGTRTEPLDIAESDFPVDVGELEALLEDVVALSGGTITFSEFDSGPDYVDANLDAGDLGTLEVYAWNLDSVMAEGLCKSPETECEVLYDSASATVWLASYRGEEALWYRALTGGRTSLAVRVTTVGLSEGAKLDDLVLVDGDAFRDAVIAAVPDAEAPDRDPVGVEELMDVARNLAQLTTAQSGEFVREPSVHQRGQVFLNGEYAFDASANLETGADAYPLAGWTESCALGESDGKPCTELLRTNTMAVFASTYPHQPGRENLRIVADVGEGTLSITLDNYVETTSGKVTRVPWHEAGFDPDELAAVIADSDLFDR